MRMSETMKVILFIIIGAIIMISMSNIVFAEDTMDLTGTLANTLANNSVAEGNTMNTPTTSNTSNSVANNVPVLSTNSINNTSTYNNTSLPNTGITDTAPLVIIAIVLGISAIYAYKKVQDYKNI